MSRNKMLKFNVIGYNEDIKQNLIKNHENGDKILKNSFALEQDGFQLMMIHLNDLRLISTAPRRFTLPG